MLRMCNCYFMGNIYPLKKINNLFVHKKIPISTTYGSKKKRFLGTIFRLQVYLNHQNKI